MCFGGMFKAGGSGMTTNFGNAQPSVSDIDLNENDLLNTGIINLVDPSGNGTATDGGYVRDYSEATLSGAGQVVLIGTNIASGVTTARSHGVTVRGGDVYSGGEVTDKTVAATLRSGKIRSGGIGPETGAVTVQSGNNDEPTNAAITGRAKVVSGNNSGTGDTGEVNFESGSANIGNSGEISFKTGDSTAGDSGNTYIMVGEAPSGTRGSIINLDGSEGTIGHVWTSKGTDGEGNWEAPAAVESAYSESDVSTSPGYGSTNTRILQLSTTNTAVGSDITFASTSANGASFTLGANGMYAATFTFETSDTTREYCISKNQSTLTGNPNTLSAAEALVVGSTVIDRRNSITVTFYGTNGDVIRPNADGGTIKTGANDCRFRIIKINTKD